MSFDTGITEAEIAAVRLRLHEGEKDADGNPLWTETAEQWYNRNVKAVGEDTAVIWFKQKAARSAGAVTC